uniref:Pentatricopeptide repeat-containing protein n=1 Tax=Peronospora matthiolae TaxID=2874970 RepID=A0AAV1U6N0_9STRA
MSRGTPEKARCWKPTLPIESIGQVSGLASDLMTDSLLLRVRVNVGVPICLRGDGWCEVADRMRRNDLPMLPRDWCRRQYYTAITFQGLETHIDCALVSPFARGCKAKIYCAVAVNAQDRVLPRRQDRSSSRASALRPRAQSPVNQTLPKKRSAVRTNLNVLLSNQTPPTTFVATCRALRAIDETALLVTIDVRTWNVALQRRPEAQDERVAAELLGLIASCSCKMQDGWPLDGQDDAQEKEAVKCWRLHARILLVLRSIQCEISSNKGSLNCLKQVCTRNRVRNVVHVFLGYVEGTCRAAGGKVEKVRTRVLERGFGAAIQCCVKLEESLLALHCYEVMESKRERLVCAGDGLPVDDAIDEAAEGVGIVDEVLPDDENIYVNVLKACMEIEDFSAFKDAFRGMVARGVARSAGFWSAIRYCHKHLDPVFHEEVLDEVFWTEQKLAGA